MAGQNNLLCHLPRAKPKRRQKNSDGVFMQFVIFCRALQKNDCTRSQNFVSRFFVRIAAYQTNLCCVAPT
jgi:hypothetical protein